MAKKPMWLFNAGGQMYVFDTEDEATVAQAALRLSGAQVSRVSLIPPFEHPYFDFGSHTKVVFDTETLSGWD